jgi:hypothetical protein
VLTPEAADRRHEPGPRREGGRLDRVSARPPGEEEGLCRVGRGGGPPLRRQHRRLGLRACPLTIFVLCVAGALAAWHAESGADAVDPVLACKIPSFPYTHHTSMKNTAKMQQRHGQSGATGKIARGDVWQFPSFIRFSCNDRTAGMYLNLSLGRGGRPGPPLTFCLCRLGHGPPYLSEKVCECVSSISDALLFGMTNV